MPHRRNQSDGTNDSRRKFLKASGAGAVALSLAGCSGDNDPGDTTQDTTEGGEETTTEDPTQTTVPGEDPTEGGTLTYGMSSKPDAANVLTYGSVYAGVAMSLVYEGGTQLDPVTSEVKPWVFTDWTIEESDEPDIYFNMREGLKWNDGEDFTKEDVLFTYNYFMDQQPGNYAATVGPMESIEESSRSDWDFHLKLNSPVGTWEIDQVGLTMLPKHIWEGKAYDQHDPMEANGDHGPVGLGPGRLTKFDPATSMQVVFDNDNYTLSELDWVQEHDQILEGGPFLDQVNFTVFGSETAMTNAYLEGDIDTHYGSLKTSKIPQAQDQDGLKLINGKDSGFSYYAFNLRRKPLDDASLRQAMAMMYDDYFWVERLMSGYVWEGDFVQSNGYPVPRPDYQFAGEDELMTHPATNAFQFRSAQSAVPDVEGIRNFLSSGTVIDGSSGTYVGKEYPGSLSDISASQSESRYDYSFGEVQSDVLANHEGADQEIRVNGNTIPEVMDGEAITLFMDPPKQGPKEAKALERWVSNLKDVGIPIKTQALSFNTMQSRVYYQEDFDMYPMGWGGTGPFGSSAHAFFHSSMADDHSEVQSGEEKNDQVFMYNSTGYGLHGGSADELLTQSKETLEPEARNTATAKAIEKIYLDAPYILRDYAKFRWPANSADFQGFLSNIVDPAYANWYWEANNIHQTE